VNVLIMVLWYVTLCSTVGTLPETEACDMVWVRLRVVNLLVLIY
jgi:hypothetical protein